MKDLMLKVLNDTVEYYSKDKRRRGEGDDGCQYFVGGKNGCPDKMCAVGRYIEPKNRFKANKLGAMWNDGEFLIPLLKKEVRSLDITFWSNLQDLHDDERYWGVKNRKELKKRVDFIKGRIEKGFYDY